MKYIKIKEYLKGFKKIFVTGPQRSGTAIAAKIIAQDLDIPHFDELSINCYNLKLTADIINTYPAFVLQCPGLCAWLQDLGAADSMIIFMRRNIEDIIKSEERVGWDWAFKEYEQYQIAFSAVKAFEYWTPIAEHKRITWEIRQQAAVINYIDLDYESLADHPLWIPKEKRAEFLYKQTAEA